jgi:hypothetical protein
VQGWWAALLQPAAADVSPLPTGLAAAAAGDWRSCSWQLKVMVSSQNGLVRQVVTVLFGQPCMACRTDAGVQLTIDVCGDDPTSQRSLFLRRAVLWQLLLLLRGGYAIGRSQVFDSVWMQGFFGWATGLQGCRGIPMAWLIVCSGVCQCWLGGLACSRGAYVPLLLKLVLVECSIKQQYQAAVPSSSTKQQYQAAVPSRWCTCKVFDTSCTCMPWCSLVNSTLHTVRCKVDNTVTVTVTWIRVYLNTPLGASMARGVPGSQNKLCTHAAGPLVHEVAQYWCTSGEQYTPAVWHLCGAGDAHRHPLVHSSVSRMDV